MPTPTKLITIETAAPATAPSPLRVLRGETWTIRALLLANGQPLNIPSGAAVTLYWQVPGMANAWWSALGRVVTGTPGCVEADWSPECDTGAPSYILHLAVALTGGAVNYSAWATLAVAHAPGASPNHIPIPPQILDYATIEVLHAPYYTKSQSDARYYTRSQSDGRYAHVGTPIVYTSITVVDQNEDNLIAIASNARTITMVRDATSETPQTVVLTLPLTSGTLALSSQIPDVSGYAKTGEANTWSAAQTFTADLTADHIYPKVVELNGAAATRDDAWANYMADYGTVGSIIRDTLPDYIRDKTRYTLDTLTVTNGAAQLIDRSVQMLALTEASTTVALPQPVANHARDLYVCVRNDSAATAVIEFSGLGTSFAIRVPDGEDLSDMTEFAAGARADIYVTETPEVHSGLPVLKVVRQDLDAVVASVSS